MLLLTYSAVDTRWLYSLFAHATLLII